MYNISYIFIQFIIYSVLGYISEVIYCSFLQKKWVNRGFLFGPLCPIYGFGAILTIYTLKEYLDDPIIVFVMGMLITSILEYFTSYIFEKIFNNKWWDYSYRKDSINGRICLQNSILFGFGILIVLYIVNPVVDNIILSINSKYLIIISILLFIIVVADFIWSVVIAYNLRSRLIAAEELKNDKLKLIPQMFESKHKGQLAKIKFKQNRLIKNYPNLAKDLRKELNDIKNMVIDAKGVKKSPKKKGKNVKFK